MCFVDNNEAFDKVPRKVNQRAKRKKGLSGVIVRAVINFCHKAKMKVEWNQS